MKKETIIVVFSALFVVLLASQALASEVGYIYKSGSKIDNQILGILRDFNFTIVLINENSLWNTNLSNYDLVFIGDEQFTRDLKIGTYPAIIMNSYLKENSGLTDNDGVSSLSSALQPLRINLNNSYIYAYTSSKNNYGDPLSYYFIDQKNKAPSMIKYAGTYDTSSGGDLGDVISFSNLTGTLLNGNSINESICFFGLKETKFWTEQTKRLFEECVTFVSGEEIERDIACYSDFECDDGSDLTEDSCINPGRYNSICANTDYDFATIEHITATAGETNVLVNVEINLRNSTGIHSVIFSKDRMDWIRMFLNSSSASYNFEGLAPGTEYEFVVKVIDSENRTSPDTLIKLSTTSTTVEPPAANTGGGSGGGGGGSRRTTASNSTNNTLTGLGSNLMQCGTQWNCTEWSPCENGYQFRTCSYEEGKCIPEETLPEQSRSCTVDDVEDANDEEKSWGSRITGAAIGAGGVRSPLLWILIFLLIVFLIYVYTKDQTKKSDEKEPNSKEEKVDKKKK